MDSSIFHFTGVAPQRRPTWTISDGDVATKRKRTVKTFLDEIAALAAKKSHRQSAARIHDFVVDRLQANDLALVDAALRELEPSRVTSYELTSFLIVTRPVAERLEGRRRVRRAAESALLDEVGADEATRTLKFL